MSDEFERLLAAEKEKRRKKEEADRERIARQGTRHFTDYSMKQDFLRELNSSDIANKHSFRVEHWIDTSERKEVLTYNYVGLGIIYTRSDSNYAYTVRLYCGLDVVGDALCLRKGAYMCSSKGPLSHNDSSDSQRARQPIVASDSAAVTDALLRVIAIVLAGNGSPYEPSRYGAE